MGKSTQQSESDGVPPSPERLGSELMHEHWKCEKCGSDAPCHIDIAYLPTPFKHVEEQQRLRRFVCLCKEEISPKWERIPNTKDHRQGVLQGVSNE